MFRLAAVCVGVLATTVGGAPVPREDMRPPLPLAGSVWEGDGVVTTPTVYEFHTDGHLTMTHSGRRYINVGTWKQDGRKVYWEANEKYCEFEGTVTGTTIKGRSWNKPGGKWELTIKRKTAQLAE